MSRKVSGKEKEIIKEMRLSGYGSNTIAKRLNCDPKTIRNWFKKLNLPPNLKDTGIELKTYNATITCKNCGIEYATQRRTTKFCSDYCRLTHNKKTILKKDKKCKNCGETFKTYKSDYCSDACRDIGRRKRPFNQLNKIRSAKKMHIKKCIRCTSSFVARYKNKQICDSCREIEKLPHTHSIKCKECGNHKEVSFKRKTFCSLKCSKRYAYRKNEITRRNKIITNGNPNWDINIDRLLKRDGNKCSICNKEIVRNSDTNNPYYPSIEHVIPISKGGTHTWDNVKLAHRKCNWEKGDKLL